ncbi:MAG TPA: hypothetical protein DCM67_01015 [Propionibacteriaceae bacterium]|nr:hypothetical protein [Propionibacteriaceae bacterium]
MFELAHGADVPANVAAKRNDEGVSQHLENQVEVLYSYTVATDSGFAPNPYFGVCTLACCKPALRRGVGSRLVRDSGIADLGELRKEQPGFVRGQNIWVLGLAGAALRDRPYRSVVYVMQVTDVLDFRSYFEEYPEKRPVLTAASSPSDPRWHGDAIYTGNDPATARQVTPCAHSRGDAENVQMKYHDLSGRFVLVSDHFSYFGRDAPPVPLEARLHHGRGHRCNYPTEVLRGLEALLNGPWAEYLDSGVLTRSGEASASSCDCGASQNECAGHNDC